MPNVGTLTVAVGADVEGLRKGPDRAVAQTEVAGRRM